MKKIKLARYGGLSPIKQTHYTTDYENMSYHGAPEKFGFYSFLFPYIDWFLLTVETGKMKSRVQNYKNKREALNVTYKKFSVDGYIWTHIEPKGKLRWMCEGERGDWYKVHSDNFPKLFAEHHKEMSKEYWQINKEWGYNTKPQYEVKNPFTLFSVDHLEIFIPKGTTICNF